MTLRPGNRHRPFRLEMDVSEPWFSEMPAVNGYSSTRSRSGAAWSATHIWEYFLFTGDTVLLRDYG